jgi:hypothetical protein
MAAKLSETQTALIRAASQRDDRLFTFPEGRGKAAALQAVKPLLAAGLAREVRARGEAPIWRRDKNSHHAFALKLTAAGAKAIAALAGDDDGVSQKKQRGVVDKEPGKAERPSACEETAIAGKQPDASFAAPRSGTKIDGVVKMLSRPEGATLEAIIKATGWLPHTTYAALTGLRKRGYILERSGDEKVGLSVYRLAAPSRTGA